MDGGSDSAFKKGKQMGPQKEEERGNEEKAN